MIDLPRKARKTSLPASDEHEEEEDLENIRVTPNKRVKKINVKEAYNFIKPSPPPQTSQGQLQIDEYCTSATSENSDVMLGQNNTESVHLERQSDQIEPPIEVVNHKVFQPSVPNSTMRLAEW